MSRFHSSTICKAAAAIVATALPLAAAHAEDRCATPQPGAATKACLAARQGPVELRRFVERTRMIYGLYYWDYARQEPAAVSGGGEQGTLAELAPAEASPRVTLR